MATTSARSATTAPTAPSARSAAPTSRERSSPPWARLIARAASPAAVAADPFLQVRMPHSIGQNAP